VCARVPSIIIGGGGFLPEPDKPDAFRVIPGLAGNRDCPESTNVSLAHVEDVNAVPVGLSGVSFTCELIFCASAIHVVNKAYFFSTSPLNYCEFTELLHKHSTRFFF
jgi:hypothetical protein